MASNITYPAEVHWAVVRERDELRAEVERLREAVLAYDDAIRQVAMRGRQWVKDNACLDALYAAMVSAAGREEDE
jgi:aspartate ammonia-lyase